MANGSKGWDGIATSMALPEYWPADTTYEIAFWTPNRYYVHFDASGGSGTAEPVEMTVGTPAPLPPCPFAKVAHDFAGWATEPGGEVVYADGAQVADLAYAQNAAVTLYAVWRSRDWTPAGAPDIVVEGVSIPIAWLDEAAASIVAANGGDFAAAARAMAANGRDKVWECYVAGLDPTNATSRLLATIEMENGEPVVTWTPDLNEGGTKSERVYTVEGKENLADPTWGPTNAATRFFRVKVEMP